MTLLGMVQLRKLFLGEGKIGGLHWHTGPPDLPAVLEAHLDHVASIVVDSLLLLDHVGQEAVLNAYVAGARATRGTGEGGDSRDIADVEIIRRRVVEFSNELLSSGSIGLGDPLVPWCDPSPDILEIVERLAASDEPAGAVEIAQVFVEVGRLSGPLILPIDEPEFPSTIEAAYQLVAALALLRQGTELVYDNNRSNYVKKGFAEYLDEFTQSNMAALLEAQASFFSRFPVGTPLPTDEVARDREIAHRAHFRSTVLLRCTEALLALTQPITALIDSHARQEAEERAERSRLGFPRPGVQTYGVSPRGAEFWVRDLLRHLGAIDAEVTRATNDGGADVLSESFVCSVKHYAGSVPVEEVREILAVATVAGKKAVLFTAGSITESGRAFADLAPVHLVKYDVADASVVGLNDAGSEFLAGLGNSATDAAETSVLSQ